MQRQEECFTPTLPSNDQSQTNNSHQPKLPATPTDEGCSGKTEHGEIPPANPDGFVSSLPGDSWLCLPLMVFLLHLHPWLSPAVGKSLCWDAAGGAGDSAGSLPAGPCIILGLALAAQPCCRLTTPDPLC